MRTAVDSSVLLDVVLDDRRFAERSEAALRNLAEVYRLLRAYGLADSVLLDLGEVRGFDYYSGVHFEAYVSGLGASLVGGGRYDQMLRRFGYDCPATGFARRRIAGCSHTAGLPKIAWRGHDAISASGGSRLPSDRRRPRSPGPPCLVGAERQREGFL